MQCIKKVVKVSSNWKKLQSKIVDVGKGEDARGVKEVGLDGKRKKSSECVDKDAKKDDIDQKKKRKRTDLTDAISLSKQAAAAASSSSLSSSSSSSSSNNNGKTKNRLLKDEEKTMYVGLDCEMVGVGSTGKTSVLARACLVDYDGEVIYDKFVRPQEFVTDFRTKWSGVRKENFRKNEGAITLRQCQNEVAALLADKYLVGHALKNDLSVLLLSHKRSMIRDTATYRPYMKPHARKAGKFKPRALRDLTQQFLDYQIQGGEHDPSEDARAAMDLYKHRRDEWELSLKQNSKIIADKNKASSLMKERTKSKKGTSSDNNSNFSSRGRPYSSR